MKMMITTILMVIKYLSFCVLLLLFVYAAENLDRILWKINIYVFSRSLSCIPLYLIT